jgi:hypothetical protein
VGTHAVNVYVRVGDLGIAHHDGAVVRLLQQVHATQQGGLTGTRRADKAHDLARFDLHVNALENLNLAVGLAQVRNAHRGGGHG